MKKEQLPTVADLATIRTRIYNVRGKNVMIDKDLAVLYGVETKRINEQVRRNKERFPEDFMFQLTKEECSRSQIATLNIKQGENIKYMPYAFTELGVAMLSSVLRSPIAIQVNINIMRAFVEMRERIVNLSENA
ncbi:MAG: ORF6N domain-containing protein, partial [Bacteroidales bacterium]|nr:ORF6N domain-containing protein [Bacteroidales bacterium]